MNNDKTIKFGELKIFNNNVLISSIAEENSGDKVVMYFCDREDEILFDDEIDKNKVSHVLFQQAGEHPDWFVRIKLGDDVVVNDDFPGVFEFTDEEGNEYEFWLYGNKPLIIF